MLAFFTAQLRLQSKRRLLPLCVPFVTRQASMGVAVFGEGEGGEGGGSGYAGVRVAAPGKRWMLRQTAGALECWWRLLLLAFMFGVFLSGLILTSQPSWDITRVKQNSFAHPRLCRARFLSSTPMPEEASSVGASAAMAQVKERLGKFETEEGRLKGLAFRPQPGDVFVVTTPKVSFVLGAVSLLDDERRSRAGGRDRASSAPRIARSNVLALARGCSSPACRAACGFVCWCLWFPDCGPRPPRFARAPCHFVASRRRARPGCSRSSTSCAARCPAATCRSAKSQRRALETARRPIPNSTSPRARDRPSIAFRSPRRRGGSRTAPRTRDAIGARHLRERPRPAAAAAARPFSIDDRRRRNDHRVH